jgi:MFS family permease
VISLARYSTLLARPTLRTSIAASFLGRLPIGIAGMAILMLAQSTSGSFARGGTVAACYTVGLAALAPALGRAIDRYGPKSPLLASAFAFPAALLALVVALQSSAPLWIAGALAAAAGACFPPITVCMRTFLKQQLQDDALLAAAYSLESVLIETIFIVGPLLVAFFVALVSPAAAVLFAAACGLAGTLLFRAAPALAEWRIEARRAASIFGPLAEPGFVPLLVVVFCYSSAFGLVEIGCIAYASELGRPAFAGVLLGIMSVSSAAGGLVYGSRTWGLPLARQFPLALAIMGLSIAPLAFLAADWAFALWCLPAGLAMAPALIMQAMLVAKLSRPDQSTEAFTWSTTALLTGVSAGLALGGFLLEWGRSPAALGAAALLGLAASVLALKLVRLPA